VTTLTTYPNPNQWDLPGGIREDGETAVACALRELEEEFGVQLPEDTVIHEAIYTAEAGGNLPERDVAFFACVVPKTSLSKIVFGDEGQCWRMMPISAFLSFGTQFLSCRPRSVPFGVIDRTLGRSACGRYFRPILAQKTQMSVRSRRPFEFTPIRTIRVSARVESTYSDGLAELGSCSGRLLQRFSDGSDRPVLVQELLFNFFFGDPQKIAVGFRMR
jgi:ADP-ribose pyrophosphatase YjhB (NUDIX family)